MARPPANVTTPPPVRPTGTTTPLTSRVGARRTRALLVALLLALAGTAVVGAAGPVAPARAATGTVPRPDHVVIVVEENESAAQILGNPDAPYINALARQGANFTQSYALTHPSQPNYLALFSGSTQGVTDDSCPHSFGTGNLGDQLLSAGLGFVGYSEDLPAAGSTVCASGKYARKHAPWTDWPSLPAATQQPMSAFPTDFSTLPAVSFVIPNLDHDMHDGTVAQADGWLHDHLDGYVQWARTHNSVLLFTFDEDDSHNGNRIPTFLVGQPVVPGSYDEYVDHYAVLRTLEDAYGLPPLGAAASATPITDVWTGQTTPPPASGTLATDAFARTVTGGLGAADVGGAWSTTGSTANYAVSPGSATLRMASGGSQVEARLGAVRSTDTDLLTTVGLDRATTGSGVYLSVLPRSVAPGVQYRARLLMQASGAVALGLWAAVPAETTIVAPRIVPGLTWSPGSTLSVRAEAVGTNPTTLRARVWATGTPEPTGWFASATDTTAALQAAGGVGLNSYLSSTATNAPVTARLTSLSATPSGSANPPTPPPPNQPPHAVFTTSCTALTCTVDASGSSDPDGTLTGYAWTFGDGTGATGRTATHTYPAAGSYPVGLTVTDDAGATDRATATATAVAPSPSVLAADTFARSVSAGFGSADVGGPWTTTGSAGAYAVGGGVGTVRLDRPGTQLAGALGQVSAVDQDVTLDLATDKAVAGNGLYVTLGARRTAATTEYRARVRLLASGAVVLNLSRLVAGNETALTGETVQSGVSGAPGTVVHLRLRVTGTAPATLRAHVWNGTNEPTGWLTATDGTAALQTAGALGFWTYLSSQATDVPVTLRLTGLRAVVPTA
ncbi:alkaline phosphatase family protein [Microlunatus kandeliicorticis]|uniref:alkaline phosphatase family protein n=1 Tax=Microlunatus kandeliicorticis TaxID=1759536 RepID=UPI0015FCA6C1|nr:alkaline phosphatase family protein [Microlunatus kandeliicorticis]